MRRLRITSSFILSVVMMGLIMDPAVTDMARAEKAHKQRKIEHTVHNLAKQEEKADLQIAPELTVHNSHKGRGYFESRGEIVWEVPTKSKVIALSFDDGPNPKYTPEVLDLLKQYNAKATFFVLGSRVEKYPKLARREFEEGHELANHTYSHCNMVRVTSAKLQEEMTKANDAIYSVTGKKPALFRPPTGYYNETIVNTARDAGFIVIMWSWHQDTRDWSNPGTQKIINQVLNNARHGDIVLFHDHGGRRRQTIEALKEILPELQQRGYKFVTISELLALRNNPLPHLTGQN